MGISRITQTCGGPFHFSIETDDFVSDFPGHHPTETLTRLGFDVRRITPAIKLILNGVYVFLQLSNLGFFGLNFGSLSPPCVQARDIRPCQ